MAEGEGQPSPMDIGVEDEGAMSVDELEDGASDKTDDSEPMNALRPGNSERGHLVQQDTGTSGSHSPVGGMQCQPEDIQNALRPGTSERGHFTDLVQQDSGCHCPVGGMQCQSDDIQNALRPGRSERGHLVQQDTGTYNGRHSPVGGSQYQPEDIQVEAQIQAELLFIVFLLFLYTPIYM